MSTILTDDEIRSAITEALKLKPTGLEEIAARAVESAVLAKLARREPVAEIEVNAAPAGGVTATVWSVHLAPGTYSLHLHPAPQQADRQRVPDGWREALEVARDTLNELSQWVEMRPRTHPWDTWQKIAPAVAQINAMLAAAPEAPAQASAVDERAAFEAELRRLHALNDELTNAYRKMYNAAAGYSNYCEDSASVRRCERDFEEADAMFRAALAQKGAA